MERPTSTNLDDVRKQAEFDRHMSFARVNRMRGDYGQAAESVRLALQVKPDDAEALEFAADILAARGELQKASEIYKSLFEANPARTSAEQKFARLTIQIAEGARQQGLLKEMAENPAKSQAARGARSPLYAALLSSAPGFGQIYCGQFVKGVVICITVLVSWFFFRLLAPDVSFYAPDARLGMFAKNMSPMALVFALIAFFVHLYAIVDAPVYAYKLKENETKNGSEPE
ncbi:MAG: tetratricopeptide repeat protein [Armatimonadetes bacterium]|nr:tetratricopeptide repeat protein [Armatimonadota bacterium]